MGPIDSRGSDPFLFVLRPLCGLQNKQWPDILLAAFSHPTKSDLRDARGHLPRNSAGKLINDQLRALAFRGSTDHREQPISQVPG
jgi:hypothetical protein